MEKLTNYQKQTVIPTAIESYLEETKSNQAQLARNAKVGEAYVTHIVKKKLTIGETEIKDKYYYAICDVIGLNLNGKIWKHFNTYNFQLIVNQIKKTRDTKGRSTIDGDTGAGKSYACKRYKTRFPQGTYVVTCSAIENSKEFAINIAESVGVETHGTAGSIIKRVVKKLRADDDAILIIDEAEHIKQKSGYINIIKSLADLLENQVAFMLCGMDINDILQKGYDRNKQNFRQTARRFSEREHCNKDIREDVIMICQKLGIHNKPSQKWMANRMHNFGELEAFAVKVMEEAQKQETTINTKFLESLYV